MITSLANGRIKRLILLQEKSHARKKEGLFVAEGIKMFDEAPPSALREVYCEEGLWRRMQKEECYSTVRAKIHGCMAQGVFVEQVSEAVLRHISDTQTPQGMVFVVEQFSYSLDKIVKEAVRKREEKRGLPLFLILEDIQDPGNLGTMLRTGEGAGVDGMIMSRGTVDIYNPKTVRSTMGSLYRVPFFYVEELKGAVRLLQQEGISVYAAHLKGERFFDEVSYERGSAFLIGNEGNGLKKETAGLADGGLKIPMAGSLESLNAATSAALLLYQAAGYARKHIGR